MGTEITTGDDISLIVNVTYNNAPVTIDPGATVKVALTTMDRIKLTEDVVCDSAAHGADWSSGVVVAEFSSEETEAIVIPEPGRVLVEVQIDYSGKKKTYWSVTTVRLYDGTID